MGMICVLESVKPAELNQFMNGSRQAAYRDGPSTLSLEKAWHGVHYLLTGSSGEDESDSPLGFLLEHGQPVGEDTGYGPARALDPKTVKAIDAALSQISDDEFWSRFNPDDMNDQGIYPQIWDEDPSDLQDEYVGYFQELKQFIKNAAKRGDLVLVTIQ
jgi:hypothetical protein